MTREIRRSPPISGHTRTFAGSTRVLMKTSCAGSLTLLFLTAAAPEIRAQVRFVDATAGGANTGTSWTDAFVDLHGAMLTVPAGTELWVRGGTYLASGTGDQACTPAPGSQTLVTFAVSGTPGLPTLLALGAPGNPFVLLPLGAVGLSLAQPIVVIGMPPNPGSHQVATIRAGWQWTAQAVAFGGVGGTLSNPVTFDL